ncbi:MAG TPA: carboxylating nicotinate-nucleotide diphosphorylase [Ignavibacteria bacterium]
MKDYYYGFGWKYAKKLILQAFKEDIGSGDVTSEKLIPAKQESKAKLKLKENSVIAGLKVYKYVFNLIDPKVKVILKSEDGIRYKKGKILAIMKGNTRNLLAGERLSLNIIQRMSGIANSVYDLKNKLNNDTIKILDTRKTTPNFRIFEKLAVKIGGGVNHRFGLYDMILIKDNHINANNGILNTLNVLKKIKNKLNLQIEIEVKSIKDFQIIQEYGKGIIDIVMLDNFDFKKIKKAVELNEQKFRIELSGGINTSNISDFEKIRGIDYISSGSLTHSYRSTDISLDFNT